MGAVSFPAPTGEPIIAEKAPVNPEGHFVRSGWACFVYLHPTKRNSIRLNAKNNANPTQVINIDLPAGQLATFDPDRFWKGQAS